MARISSYSLLIQVPALLDTARPILASCRETTAALAEIIPPNQFWKWKDMWSNSLRSAVFSATLVEYLHSGGLLTLEQVAEILGSKCHIVQRGLETIASSSPFLVNPGWQDRFALSVEDYLHGVINLVNELVSILPHYWIKPTEAA